MKTNQNALLITEIIVHFLIIRKKQISLHLYIRVARPIIRKKKNPILDSLKHTRDHIKDFKLTGPC